MSKGNGILTAEQGDKGVAYVCIFLAAQVFYQFSLGFYRLIEWDFKDEIDANANKDMESGNNEDEHSESSGSEKNDEHNVESNEDFESPDSSPLISIPLPHSKLVQDDSSSISSTQLEANLNPQILTDCNLASFRTTDVIPRSQYRFRYFSTSQIKKNDLKSIIWN